MDYREIMRRHGVSWQAHRGGGGLERPDNTLAAARYGWSLGGIPELDVRRTADDALICLHDETLARTTDAPPDLRDIPVSQLALGQVRPWDAGARFGAEYAGERVPTLREVFAEMAGQPDRCAYLDLKDVDLDALARLIAEYSLGPQLIVCSPSAAQCASMRALAEGLRSMLWIGGSRERILAVFEECRAARFAGLDQVQFHLNDADPGRPWPWQIQAGDLTRALEICRGAGIDLEVLPWHFTAEGIHSLLGLGVRWYATDEPGRFAEAVASWV